MPATKRKVLGGSLQRRVRARREDSEGVEDLSDSEAPSVHGNNEEGTSDESDAGEEDGNEDEDEGEGGSSDQESELASDSGSESEDGVTAASISFGALAKAQATLGGKGRKKKGEAVKLDKRGNPIDATWSNNEATERKEGRKDHRDFGRSNKHAPTEMSSKKAVSRKREVVPIVKVQHRDPRFEPLAGPAIDENKVKRAYGFLDDYREDEMKELRLQIKKTKDESEKERMKRQLLSMESKKKSDDRKRMAEEVIAKHRKEERELVKQGKQPFYLKKAEQKKRVLLDQYKDLKGKQLDHVIERKRKKMASKEKKNMPFARRSME